jgi:hypothetical protein
MQRPSPLRLRPVPSRLSQPGHSIRPANLSADLNKAEAEAEWQWQAEAEAETLLVPRVSLHSASVLNRRGIQTPWLPVHARLPPSHLASRVATVGILAGRFTSPSSHGPSPLGLGPPDAQRKSQS